jgi:hypothetical protein
MHCYACRPAILLLLSPLPSHLPAPLLVTVMPAATPSPPVHLRSAVRDPQIQRALLAVRDVYGWLAYHHLAEAHPAALRDLLLRLPDADAAAILAATNPRVGLPVAHALAARDPAALAGVLAARRGPRAAALWAADRDGWLVYHVLARRDGRSLLWLLRRLGTADALAVAAARGPCHQESVGVRWAGYGLWGWRPKACQGHASIATVHCVIGPACPPHPPPPLSRAHIAPFPFIGLCRWAEAVCVPR